MYRFDVSGPNESICWAILIMSSVVTPRIWVSPRSNSALPCARNHGHLGRQCANVGDAAAVDTEMVGEDALPNQLFGQGTQRGADLLSRPS